MTLIFTGEINSGKTTSMRRYYAEQKAGDGVFCDKVFREEEHIGYNLFLMGTGETLPFIRKKESADPEQSVIYTLGPYLFYSDSFKRAIFYLEQKREERVSPLYIDELGKLECRGEGFFSIASSILESGLNLVTSIRHSCQDELIRKLNISRDSLREVVCHV